MTRSRLGRMMNSVVKSVITPVQNRIKSFMNVDDLIEKDNQNLSSITTTNNEGNELEEVFSDAEEDVY